MPWIGATEEQPTSAHPVVSGAIQQLATGLLVLPVASFVPGHAVNWHSRGLWAIAYLVIFGSIVGYSSYIYALEHLPVSVVSTYAYAIRLWPFFSDGCFIASHSAGAKPRPWR